MGLFDLFSNETADEAARKANEGIQRGLDTLYQRYGEGRQELRTGYGKAGDVYSDLSTKYGAGADAYADASGANGVEGLKRATETFKNSGQYGTYGFNLDQGLQALTRAHSAAGNLSSGNTDTDAMKFASGLAGNTWGSYQTGLKDYLGAYGNAASGLANTYTGLGTALNTSLTGEGNAANAAFTGMGKNDAAAEMNNYQVGANQLNAIMGAVKLAMAIPTGGASLFGGFGGGAPTQQQNFWSGGNTGPV